MAASESHCTPQDSAPNYRKLRDSISSGSGIRAVLWGATSANINAIVISAQHIEQLFGNMPVARCLHTVRHDWVARLCQPPPLSQRHRDIFSRRGNQEMQL